MLSNARALVDKLLGEGMSKAALAKEIGYDRSTVSRWINEPDYNGTHIAKAVMDRYSRFTCPFLKIDITPAQCASHASRACPTSNARDVRHWKSCQTCPHKPKGETK